MNPFQQGLDMQPASPQGLPARWTLAFAAQVAAIAGDGMPALLDRHRRSFPLLQMRHHLDDVGWQDLACGLLWILPGGGTQLHQAHGHGSKQPQERAQSLIVLHLTLLDLAARFETLMKVFSHPAGTVPVHALLSLLLGRRGKVTWPE